MLTSVDDQADFFDKVSVTGLFGKAVILCHCSTMSWRRMVLEEAKGVNKAWAEIKADAKNRVRWNILVEALCSAAE
jgi:hypothetical protein